MERVTHIGLRCGYCGIVHRIEIATEVRVISAEKINRVDILLPHIKVLDGGDCAVISVTDVQ